MLHPCAYVCNIQFNPLFILFFSGVWFAYKLKEKQRIGGGDKLQLTGRICYYFEKGTLFRVKNSFSRLRCVLFRTCSALQAFGIPVPNQIHSSHRDFKSVFLNNHLGGGLAFVRYIFSSFAGIVTHQEHLQRPTQIQERHPDDRLLLHLLWVRNLKPVTRTQ